MADLIGTSIQTHPEHNRRNIIAGAVSEWKGIPLGLGLLVRLDGEDLELQDALI